MAWSDYWTPIRYGVAAVAGLTIAAVSYLALVGDEYVPVDAYAEVLLGTIERCQATATGRTIETNTVTNITFGYAADPSGRCWGGTNVYLVPVYTTNVSTDVITNWTYAAAPPAVVTVERITVGRVAAVVTNGAAVYTNDSPAVLTNVMTNAITPYIPAGAIETLQAAAEAAVPYYLNNAADPPFTDAWTVTGMFFTCGFTNGWNTNAGPEYVAKTNMAQIYQVLYRLRELADATVDSTIYVRRQGYEDGTDDGLAYLKGVAESEFSAASTTASVNQVATYTAVYSGPLPPLLYAAAYAGSAYAVVDNDYSGEVLELVSLDYYVKIIELEAPPAYVTNVIQTFDDHGTGYSTGWNFAGGVLIDPTAASHTSGVIGVDVESGTFPLTWAVTTEGYVVQRGFRIDSILAYKGMQFLYCTNAP